MIPNLSLQILPSIAPSFHPFGATRRSPPNTHPYSNVSLSRCLKLLASAVTLCRIRSPNPPEPIRQLDPLIHTSIDYPNPSPTKIESNRAFYRGSARQKALNCLNCWEAVHLLESQRLASNEEADRLLQASGLRFLVLGGLYPADIPSTL